MINDYKMFNPDHLLKTIERVVGSVSPYLLYFVPSREPLGNAEREVGQNTQ
jgi:hypothetical protein